MYIHFNNNPRGNTQAGDCVIRAISRATGDTWEKIYIALSVEGYHVGEWANHNGVWDGYLRRNGFTRHICPNNCPACYSIKNFAEEHPEGVYIAATGRHAVAVIDGDYWDAWDSGNETPIYYYSKEDR